MNKKLWIFQIPLVAFFLLCFALTELGQTGRLKNAFLRERIYPNLSRAVQVFTDLKFKARGPKPLRNKIVVVEIDGPAIDTLGRWPWHRDVMAYLIEKTFQSGARVVGLDAVFSEPDPRVPAELRDLLKQHNLPDVADQFETDHQLEKVIRKYSDRLVLGWISDAACQPYFDGPQNCPVSDPNAIATFPLGFERFAFEKFEFTEKFDPSKSSFLSFVTPIANIQAYSDAAQNLGYLNAVLDTDGYIRKSSVVVIANGKPYPSLPLEIARVGVKDKLSLILDSEQRLKSLEFVNSGKKLQVNSEGVMQINFRGPSESLTHLPALDVLSDKDTIEDPLNKRLTGQSKLEVLRDAFVIIGITALGVHDLRQFPFESNAPGVDGHAHILDNILSGDSLSSGSGGFGSFVIIILMLIGAIVFALAINRLDAVPALILFGVTMLVIGVFDFKYLFNRDYNWNTSFVYLEFSGVFFVTLMAKYVLEERSKKFIKSAFNKYVAPAVVESILKDPAKLSLGGEKREMSILFSDIRGFTTFSEKMDAKALAAFLNDYLGIMTKIVFNNNGTLDKYIGDAIMAFWGAPLDQPDHAASACKAAVEMMQALHQNQSRFRSQYGIDVEIGIGINSGIVNVGNMGSDQNFEYTVIGDHVNLASRVEGLTKKYGVHILTTRFTLDSVLKANLGLMPNRTLDQVKVKGKKNAIELIQLIDSPLSEEGQKRFAEAQGCYRSQEWEKATVLFQEASRLLVKDESEMDGPCQMYIERCSYFQKNPPQPDWDGSWEMDSK